MNNAHSQGPWIESKPHIARAMLIISVAVCTMYLLACSKEEPANSNQATTSPAASGAQHHVAVIETSLGTIKFELLDDEAPKTAENFVSLANRGYYNGTIFHRTINGFMIQGGDPTGTGAGGQTATGAALPNEIRRGSPLYQGGYKRGAVAMANKGTPETGSSQFFIMHQNYPQLPPNYTIFGRVTEGMDVVDKIATAPTMGDRPTNPIKMNKVYIQ